MRQTIPLSVNPKGTLCTLPRDRERLVATLKWRAENVNDRALAGLRMRMAGM